jgi:Pectate lyase superfamily protein/Right handed beta helix region
MSMADPWNRRDILERALASGIVTQLPRNGLDGAVGAVAGSGDSVVMLALFIDADRHHLPESCVLVCTGGHSRHGYGSARYRRDAAVDRDYLKAHPRTAFADASDRGFRLVTQAVDARQAGAIGDGIADDTAAIQEAMNVVEAAGGGTVVLSAGAYKVTAPLKLPPRTGLQGAGPATILHVTGCDGLVVDPSDAIGPRVISDLMIQGQGCEGYRGIVVDHPDGRRSQGIVFERLYVAFFGTGVLGRGLWHATFRTVTMNQVWNGIVLVGRTVKITVDDCRITHGGLLRGAGTSIGIQVGDETPSARPEDIQISRSIVYGFDKAIFWRTALFGSVSHCDLDACGQAGIELVTADGGFAFRDNWIQTTGTSSVGIHGPPLGYKPQPTNITIANNTISAAPGSTGTCGIAVQDGQSDVMLDSNSVTGTWQDGIRAAGVRRLSVLNNRSAAAIVVERCADVLIAHNFAAARVLIDRNTGLQTAPGFGSCSTGLSGELDVPLGKTTEVATFASLGLPDLPEGTYRTALSIDCPSQGSTGDISARATRTSITVTLPAPRAQPCRVTFRIAMF